MVSELCPELISSLRNIRNNKNFNNLLIYELVSKIFFHIQTKQSNFAILLKKDVFIVQNLSCTYRERISEKNLEENKWNFIRNRKIFDLFHFGNVIQLRPKLLYIRDFHVADSEFNIIFAIFGISDLKKFYRC